jgi:ubiquinone/menaquinone biosynthesis C-methylase UbiE
MRDLQEEVGLFDRRAGRYDRWLKQWWFFRPVHRTVLQALDPTPGDRFLEVGSGTGTLTLAVAAVTGWAEGADPAPRMIEVARRKRRPPGTRIGFVVAAAESLPYADEAFDLAATSISMHHWVDPSTGLAELRRVLKPGGRLVVADVAQHGIGRPISALTALGRRHGGSAWDRRALAELVRDAGFVRVRLRRRGLITTMVAFVAAEKRG